MSEKKGFFGRLKNGLTKTRDSFVSGMNAVFSGFSEIDDDFYEELEEQLIMADIGMNTTTRIIEDLQEKVDVCAHRVISRNANDLGVL